MTSDELIGRLTEVIARQLSSGLCGAKPCSECDCFGHVPHEARETADAVMRELADAGLLPKDATSSEHRTDLKVAACGHGCGVPGLACDCREYQETSVHPVAPSNAAGEK